MYHLALIVRLHHLWIGRLEAESVHYFFVNSRYMTYSFAFCGKQLRRLSLRLSLSPHDALHQIVDYILASLE
jgi:hypothetical protein